MRFFKWLGGLFLKLPNIASHVAEAIKEVSAAALPIVGLIASLTPTRADDEIIALFERWVIPGVESYLALPIAERGAALLKVATVVLQRRFPRVPVDQLQAAVQLALIQFRAK